MLYYVPNETEENWKENYRVYKGQYLCYFCKKPQNIKKATGYLKPCRYCGKTMFWSL